MKNFSPNITKTDEKCQKTNNKILSLTLLSTFFGEFSIYRGQVVPLNVEKMNEFYFRTFTLWLSLNYKIFAFGTHLQIMLNDCIT